MSRGILKKIEKFYGETVMCMQGLRLVRKDRHLSQQQVAFDLNITREALSHYENGRREPSLDMLIKMSRYFNKSIDFLITGKEFSKKENKIQKN